MAKLTQEEWDVLTDEEKGTRQDEKPDEAGKTSQPTVEELQKEIKELGEKISSVEDEKKGLYGDMKNERELRQQSQAELAERDKTNKDDPLAGKPDDEYLTVADVKKILASAKNTAATDREQESITGAKKRSTATYNADEEKMQEKKDLIVPYKEVLEEFAVMAKKNPALWETVHRESLRVGGKPAELAYKLGLTSKTFIDKVKAEARSELIKNLEKEGKIKPTKLPGGGASATPTDPNLLEDKDLIGMDDTALDALLKKTG